MADEIVSHEAEIEQEPLPIMVEAKAEVNSTDEAESKPASEDAEAGVAAKAAAIWETRAENPELGEIWDVADPTQIDQAHTK